MQKTLKQRVVIKRNQPPDNKTKNSPTEIDGEFFVFRLKFRKRKNSLALARSAGRETVCAMAVAVRVSW